MTETTEPDPQVVAWMRDYLRDHPAPTTYGSGNKATALRTYIQAHSPGGSIGGTGYGLRDLADAYDAARMPLTVADVPAGQGPASLFLRQRGDGAGIDLCQRIGQATVAVELGGHEMTPALRNHLAATLPTVTEDTP